MVAEIQRRSYSPDPKDDAYLYNMKDSGDIVVGERLRRKTGKKMRDALSSTGSSLEGRKNESV